MMHRAVAFCRSYHDKLVLKIIIQYSCGSLFFATFVQNVPVLQPLVAFPPRGSNNYGRQITVVS